MVKPTGWSRNGNNQELDSKQRILEHAVKEFAEYGFGGARVDRIAKNAQINKAMIFYYFSSKQNLYRSIIKNSLTNLFPLIHSAVKDSPSPEKFFETLPEIYIRYFSANRDLIRLIGNQLIQNPENLAPIIRDIFSASEMSPAEKIRTSIQTWYDQGLITESDPVHFIMNIIPLCIFSLLAKPMVEAIFQVQIDDNEDFLNQRTQSIVSLLKRGMLT